MCDCACKRTTTKLFNYTLRELNAGHIFTHKSCVCNEIIALSQRHQVDDGSRYNTGVQLVKYLRPLVKQVDPVTEDYIVSRANSTKRRLLLQAQETLKYEPLKPSDGDIKMFLKDDKYQATNSVAGFLGHGEYGVEEEFSAPRCIQYRNKRYCLRLATYLHPIEEHCYQYKDHFDTFVFAKGRNLKQRGEDLWAKWNSFSRPIALLLDHSKFDAHCSTELLNVESKFYRLCNDADELKWLLSQQLVNKGRTKNNTRYTTKATRMSGDQNTGLGNSVINYAMLSAFVDHYKLNASIYVDGDDSVIVMEDEQRETQLSFFEQFGMKTKGGSTTTFSQVEFCQSKPVMLESGYVMIRNPYRMITRTPWTVKTLPKRRVNEYLASIGRCEMALGMGAPIGQYIGHKLSLLSKRHVVTHLEYVAKQQNYRPSRAYLKPPNRDARQSYFEAWGITIEQQLAIEASDIMFNVDIESIEERPFS